MRVQLEVQGRLWAAVVEVGLQLGWAHCLGSLLRILCEVVGMLLE